MAPPLGIISVLFPGFKVPAAHGPCGVDVVASTAVPPVSGNAPASSVLPVPEEAPLWPIDPLVSGAPVPAALPVAPATPPLLPLVSVPLVPDPVDPGPVEPLWAAMPLAVPVLVPDWGVAVPALHAAPTNASHGTSALMQL
jgi:hypothetical protein